MNESTNSFPPIISNLLLNGNTNYSSDQIKGNATCSWLCETNKFLFSTGLKGLTVHYNSGPMMINLWMQCWETTLKNIIFVKYPFISELHRYINCEPFCIWLVYVMFACVSQKIEISLLDDLKFGNFLCNICIY